MFARRRISAAGLGAVALLALAAAPGVTAARIDLPTPADLTSPELPILQPRPGETETTTVPGPVSDDEKVHIGLDPTGALASVMIDQTLTLHGTGDFDIIMPGPATRVVGPADQAVQPGLRRGEILWNGFSPGVKTLRSTVTMDPTFEKFHLPLAFSVRFLQNGRQVQLPVSGPVRIEISISNETGRQIVMKDAVPGASDLADLLESLRREIGSGRRPIAGRRGVPRSVAATSSVGTRSEQVFVPIRVGGTISFPEGTISVSDVSGATQMPGMVLPTGAGGTQPPGPAVTAFRFDALLPSARAGGAVTITLDGSGSGLGAPRFDVHAAGALPDARSLDPGPTGSWRKALAGSPSDTQRYSLMFAQKTMWQVLLLSEVDAHLGNPGKGPSRTTFYFTSEKVSASPRVAPVERLKPEALALVLVAAALAIGNAALLWTRS